MSKTSQYTNWTAAPSFSLTGSCIASGLAGSYQLSADGGQMCIGESDSGEPVTENFSLFFAGTGGGVAYGLEFRGVNSLVADALSNVVNNSFPSISRPRGIAFAGETRNATSFEGFGHVIDFTLAPGMGIGMQVLLFNISFGLQQIPHVVDVAWRVIDGQLSLHKLNEIAPAVTLVATDGVYGYGAGATFYGGYFVLKESIEQQRFYVHRADFLRGRVAARRGAAGTAPTMTRRFRPH